MKMRFLSRMACAWGFLSSATFANAAERGGSARLITSSNDLQLSKTDHAICLQRKVDPHPTTIKLPADAELDQEFVVDDCAGNFASHRVTVRAPSGQAIIGPSVLNIDWQSSVIRYLGHQTWRIER